jgi:transcriptional regulator with XRE-family HTH domain
VSGAASRHGSAGARRRVCRLAEARQAAGLERRELAARAGVTYRTVAEIERGERLEGLSLGTVVRLAHALGLAGVELWPGLEIRPGGERAPRD